VGLGIEDVALALACGIAGTGVGTLSVGTKGSGTFNSACRFVFAFAQCAAGRHYSGRAARCRVPWWDLPWWDPPNVRRAATISVAARRAVPNSWPHVQRFAARAHHRLRSQVCPNTQSFCLFQVADAKAA